MKKKSILIVCFTPFPGRVMSGRRASLQACPRDLNVYENERNLLSREGRNRTAQVVFIHPHFWGWMLSLETKRLTYFCFKVTI